MSYNVAYKKQQNEFRKILGNRVPLGIKWFALKDRCGKVRDWVAAKDLSIAKDLFRCYRDYQGIPKGYTVEKRGPVTRENW